MGWHLDGRVAAVFGTHTHVPTADGRVLPGGTAFISDVGMTGSRTSVLGVKPEQALRVADHADADPVRDRRGGRLGDGRCWSRSTTTGLADSFEQVMVPAAGDVPDRRQRDQQQRVEPDDVEVEPVVQGQLQRIRRARREAATWTSDLRRGTEGEEQGERAGGGEQRDAQRFQRRDLAPDAEGGVAAGLVGDRAVVEGLQAGVDRGPGSTATVTGRADDEQKLGGEGACARGRARHPRPSSAI